MGARLAAEALKHGPKVPPHARLVLAVMALHALDRDGTKGTQARLYYGGHNTICDGLGIPPTTSNLRHVREAIALLIDAGMVTRITAGHHKRAAVYHVMPVGKS